jgi:cell division septum initiation protein DivIVA
MSTLAESLKKQNEFLQGEVERFANAVDALAAQLVDAQKQIKALEAARSEMVPVDNGMLIDGDARAAQEVTAASEKRSRGTR